MPNKNYQKGRRREYYIKSKYKELGFYVQRSAGSKGAVDLIALRAGKWCPETKRRCPIIIPIQVKSGTARITPDEKRKIFEFEEITGLTVKVE